MFRISGGPPVGETAFFGEGNNGEFTGENGAFRFKG